MFTFIVKHIFPQASQCQDSTAEISLKLDLIIQNQTKIMANIQELTAQVDSLSAQVTTLQTTLDTEQEQIKAAIDANTAEIARLTEVITALQNEAGTPEQRQALADKVTDISNRLTAINTDLQNTIADEPAGGENGGTGGTV